MFNRFKYIGNAAPSVRTGDIFNKAVTAFKESDDPWTNIVTAASMDPGAVDKRNLNFTGSVTVTAFVSAPAGTTRKCKAGAAFQITYNAVSMLTQGSENLLLRPEDTFSIISLGSGNWQVYDVVRNGGHGFFMPTKVVPSTLYNMVISDVGKMLRYTAGSGLDLFLLSAAVVGNGAVLFVENTLPAVDITIDPSGAETRDGLATRKLRPGDRVCIYSDGTNWKTLSGIYSYQPGDLVIGLSTLPQPFPHGLGVVPQIEDVSVALVCVNGPSIGWATGDIYHLGSSRSLQNVTASAIGVQVDATNINIYTSASPPILSRKDTGAGAAIVITDWAFRVRARIVY